MSITTNYKVGDVMFTYIPDFLKIRKNKMSKKELHEFSLPKEVKATITKIIEPTQEEIEAGFYTDPLIDYVDLIDELRKFVLVIDVDIIDSTETYKYELDMECYEFWTKSKEVNSD
jgi:hypothetical protein